MRIELVIKFKDQQVGVINGLRIINQYISEGFFDLDSSFFSLDSSFSRPKERKYSKKDWDKTTTVVCEKEYQIYFFRISNFSEYENCEESNENLHFGSGSEIIRDADSESGFSKEGALWITILKNEFRILYNTDDVTKLKIMQDKMIEEVIWFGQNEISINAVIHDAERKNNSFNKHVPQSNYNSSLGMDLIDNMTGGRFLKEYGWATLIRPEWVSYFGGAKKIEKEAPVYKVIIQNDGSIVLILTELIDQMAESNILDLKEYLSAAMLPIYEKMPEWMIAGVTGTGFLPANKKYFLGIPVSVEGTFPEDAVHISIVGIRSSVDYLDDCKRIISDGAIRYNGNVASVLFKEYDVSVSDDTINFCLVPEYLAMQSFIKCLIEMIDLLTADDNKPARIDFNFKEAK